MASDGWLNCWWVWLIVIFVFVVVLYLYTRITGNGIREATRTTTTRTRKHQWRSIRATPLIESLSDGEDEIPPPPIVNLGEKQQSKGEAECLRAMKRIFPDAEFEVQDRSSLIRNPKTNRKLELDIVCWDLPMEITYQGQRIVYKGIAVEYNGLQHYRYVKKFHKSPEDLEAQFYRDQVKYDRCKELGIWLITVPANVPLPQIENFIRYFLPHAVAAREQDY
jgi:hypothetical protein